MPPIRVHSLIDALAALSISDDDTSNVSNDAMSDIEPLDAPSVIGPLSPLPSHPFPSPIAHPVFTLADYRGDASIVSRWARRPEMLERYLRTLNFPTCKFPLSRPPLGLHWGSGDEDSFLFLGDAPALVYLPARLISLNPRKTDAGLREIMLEAELLDDAYYFGMVELFNLTGDDPTLDTVFYAYRNTGSKRPFKSCWDYSGHLTRPRKVKPSRFRQGNVILIECSVRRTGFTYVTSYSFFSLRAVSLLYRPRRCSTQYISLFTPPTSSVLHPPFLVPAMSNVPVPPHHVVLSFNITLDAFGLLHKATITITLNGQEDVALTSVRDFLIAHWEDWCNARLRAELLAFLSEGTGGVPL